MTRCTYDPALAEAAKQIRKVLEGVQAVTGRVPVVTVHTADVTSLRDDSPQYAITEVVVSIETRTEGRA